MALVAAALNFTASTAVAQAAEEPPPPQDSAVLQYAELVPTAHGPKAPGVGEKTQAPLTPRADQALKDAPQETASTLTDVATSSDYGAPAAATPRSTPARRDLPSTAEKPSLDRTVAATAAAVAPVEDARILGLLVAMIGIAVGGAALAARLRRP